MELDKRDILSYVLVSVATSMLGWSLVVGVITGTI